MRLPMSHLVPLLEFNQGLFPDRQRPLLKGFGLGILALLKRVLKNVTVERI
jgi:hypothetical protein